MLGIASTPVIWTAGLKTLGLTILKTPRKAPKASAIGERWIGSARRECLARARIHRQGVSAIYTEGVADAPCTDARSGASHNIGTPRLGPLESYPIFHSDNILVPDSVR